MSKGKNVRISDEAYEHLRNSLPPIFKLSKFVEAAIYDKIERDRLTEKRNYDREPILNAKADHSHPF